MRTLHPPVLSLLVLATVAALLLPLALAAGCLTIWVRSELVGTEAIARPMVVAIEGRVVSREGSRRRSR